jgi:hypothetical protein
MINTYIIDGDKGGVGKSLFARALVDYSIQRSDVVYVIDCDPTSPDVVSRSAYCVEHVGSTAVLAINLPIKNDDSIYALADGVQKLLENHKPEEVGRVIVNLPAGVGTSINEESAPALEAIGAVPIWVMSTDQSSVDQFEKRLDLPLYSDGGIVVINLRHGKREMFHRYDESRVRSLAHEKGWIEMEFPVLNNYVASKVGITPFHRLDKDVHGIGSVTGVTTFRGVVGARFKKALGF